MTQCQTIEQSQIHVETIDNTTYEVTSNYMGAISLLDLFKQMIKRDVSKMEQCY